jgi:hypothetical protein
MTIKLMEGLIHDRTGVRIMSKSTRLEVRCSILLHLIPRIFARISIYEKNKLVISRSLGRLYR